MYAVKKFKQYLRGREFILTTDHKPLLGLLGEEKPVPDMASARMQRWELTLSTYKYKLVYDAGKENVNADALSRLPLPASPTSTPVPPEILFRYRNVPHTTTGQSPAVLLLGRRPRCHLYQLRPTLAGRVEGQQLSQKKYHDTPRRRSSHQAMLCMSTSRAHDLTGYQGLCCHRTTRLCTWHAMVVEQSADS